MKLLIAGGRNIKATSELIEELLLMYGLDPVLIVHGGASGVDTAAGFYARNSRTEELCIRPKYAQFANKKAAPLARNKEMALVADALLLIWDGKSNGSAHMKKSMENLMKPIYEVIIK